MYEVKFGAHGAEQPQRRARLSNSTAAVACNRGKFPGKRPTVMAGLVPAIHAAAQSDLSYDTQKHQSFTQYTGRAKSSKRHSRYDDVDDQDKPGHDAKSGRPGIFGWIEAESPAGDDFCISFNRIWRSSHVRGASLAAGRRLAFLFRFRCCSLPDNQESSACCGPVSARLKKFAEATVIKGVFEAGEALKASILPVFRT
jgi:hypothetical protein